MNPDVVILGGGLAGLACAVGLRGSGLNVLLCERSASLGGRARSWTDAVTGDAIDIGPHIFLSEYPNMLALLDLCGTREQIVWQTEKLITWVDGNDSIDMHVHRLPPPLHLLPSMLKVRSISARDLASNIRVLWSAMRWRESDVATLDAMDARSFLRHEGVSERFIAWFWATASMTIMNVPLERCSAGALLRLFSLLIGRDDYCFGFAACGLSELFAPASRKLIEAAGGRILVNTRVNALLGGPDTVDGLILEDNTRVQARFYVCALPPHDLLSVLPDDWMSARHGLDRLSHFVPSPYISSYIWFERKLTRERFWARTFAPDKLNYDSYDLSNIRTGWEQRPSMIASNIIYSHRAAGMSDDQIVEATVRELSEFVPTAARTPVRHAVVNRVPMAIPCPHPGSERMRPRTSSSVHGLVLAGDWTRTGLPASMESAVRSGWLAAEHIWREIGQPKKLAREVRAAQGITGLVRRLSHFKRSQNAMA
jgi:zeta-carotene desaturase